jgi:hypothetical protein
MGAVSYLSEVKPVPDEDIVKMLESLLERAKGGEFISIAFAAQVIGGTSTSFATTERGDIARLHYAVSVLLHRMVT